MATYAPVAYTTAANNTQIDFDITFTFLRNEDLAVSVIDPSGNVLVAGTGYDTQLQTQSDGTFDMRVVQAGTLTTTNTPLTAGHVIRIKRNTDISTILTVFQDGASFKAADINAIINQLFNNAQETAASVGEAIGLTDDLAAFDAENKPLRNLGAPTDANDAMRKVDIDSGIGPDITTVAGIASDVTDVAAATANIAAVLVDINGTDTIGTVAGSIANVNAVGGSIANVNTVAADEADIGVVATNLNGTDTIGTVAGSIANVNAVGTNINDVTTLASGTDAGGTAYLTHLEDAADNAAAASASAAAAASSETAAAASETAAASSETAAASSETAAASSETAAANSAASASTSASNAASSEAAASSSQTAAATSATAAAASQSAAATSASGAATSETNAATSATNAATSASNAATSETNAATSASSASSSQTAAASSATAAATSASSASSSATLAASNAAAAAGIDLSSLSETINDTAVDVFVYDTSRDSDGGAWRHRTQHTSWYAEASSASRDVNTRSARAEFPAVAVIVAEAGKVTIYDGDDPSLPMWWTTRDTSTTNSLGILRQLNTYAVQAISMLNGRLVAGLDYTPAGDFQSNEGVHVLDFAADRAYKTTNIAAYCGYVSPLTSYPDTDITVSTQYAGAIVNGNINDVAMTVLPDAPTDPATGLPVPTIYAFTDGGVSRIADDGTVSSTAGTPAVDKGGIFDNRVWGVSVIGSQAGVTQSYFGSRPLSETLPTGGGANVPFYWRVGKTNTYDLFTDGTGPSIADDAFGLSTGLHHFDYNDTDNSTSLLALTTSTYNTGWMPGDIKLAALADTTAETFGDAVSGATVSDPNGDGGYDGEHITNGDFATDLTGWTDDSSGGWAYDAGRAYHALSSDFQTLRQSLDLTAGNTYVLSFDYEVVSGELRCQSRTAANLPDPAFVIHDITGTGSRSETFVATAGLDSIAFARDNSGISSEFYIDNISVRLADPDRSVNGKGLGVHGSITKAPVATGADVVAYSGFSTSNYLEQPYNADLDFGTGDFCVMGWVASAGGSGEEPIIDHSDGGGTTGIYIYQGNNGNLYARVGAGSAVDYSLGASTSDVWRHFVVTRASGTVYCYANGVLVTSFSRAGSIDTTTNKTTLIGKNFADIGADITSLALFRISATAPTADQIRKIYEDERPLFQEDAKATLTGTSDAVTALAHDPDTNLLHVGTSGGRSVFQGLRRVDETATAVTTAISAVDGLVVEQ